jgi:hypothetical protein
MTKVTIALDVPNVVLSISLDKKGRQIIGMYKAIFFIKDFIIAECPLGAVCLFRDAETMKLSYCRNYYGLKEDNKGSRVFCHCIK